MHTYCDQFLQIANRRRITRRSTLPPEEQLEAVTKYMNKEVSRMQRHQAVEEDDKESSSAPSTIYDSGSPKRFQCQ